MSTPFLIRAAALRDIPAMAALLNALNRAEGIEALTDTHALSEALFGVDRAVGLSAMVAEVNAKVVGMILYYPGYDTLSAAYGYHLADMVVAATHQRKGIGRGLLRALAEKALQKNMAWISLTVLKKNMAAHAFYSTLGLTGVAVDFMAMGKTAMRLLINSK